MAPLDLAKDIAPVFAYIVPFLVGMGFGAVLEMSGFGDSRKLAAQFYFKEMTVLKVMFTGIIVAMTLVFLSSSLGLLNFDQVYVNHTFLVPGIVGGLIMGVGFIIGGFCPGTSLVAASTLKLDGIFFVLGAFFGVFLFGESLPAFYDFHNTTEMGRFMLNELFGIPVGVVVVLVLLMALTMFYWAEISEMIFGEGKKWSEIDKGITNHKKLAGAVVILLLGVVTLINGQPTIDDKWGWIAETEERKIESREIYIHPGELHETMNDPMLYYSILDVRSERDYNMFHLENAELVTDEDLTTTHFIKRLKEMPNNTVKVVVSNGEEKATEAYKKLRAQGVINLYILSGGINHWLSVYHPDHDQIYEVKDQHDRDELKYVFARAYGESLPVSNPVMEHGHDGHHIEKFEKKIKIQKKKVVSGGCG